MDVKNDLGGGKPTLLIAEDEESNYLLQKTILHKYCNLIRAKTGLEALALFKENEVDLILMDIKMPEMTGIESLKEIRKLSKDIPVIMQSAYVFDSDMEAAKEAGASGFITKPINLKVFFVIFVENRQEDALQMYSNLQKWHAYDKKRTSCIRHF